KISRLMTVQCHLLSSVDQTPSEVIVRSGQAYTLSCSHSISSYNTILWYQHEHGQGMNIIGYSFHSTHNDGFKGRFKLKKTDTLNGALEISNLSLSDSAVYYCAVSMHSATN
uniref:Ig-like domain-containing protein n=1 Tax=Sinocyclocheilus rhinocerous TaxID=307959 RepID=A0A673HE41_9TELE